MQPVPQQPESDDPQPPPRRDGARSGLDLVTILIRRWRLLLLLPLLVMASALAFSFLLPRIYTVDSRFTPESAGSSVARLAGLAGQFGIDIPQSEGAPSLDFYAELVESGELLRGVVLTDFTVPRERATLQGNLVELFDVEGDTEAERVHAAVEMLAELVTARVDPSAEMVTLETSAPWPSLAVSLNRRILELIHEFNLERRQSRAAAERTFLEGRVQEAQADLTAAENALQQFLSANRRYEESPQLIFEHQRLQRRVEQRQEIFTALLTGYEQARVDEVRNTPVITVVDQARGPAERTSPNYVVNALLGLVLGGLIALGIVLGREMLSAAAESDPAGFARMRAALEDVKPGRGSAAVAACLLAMGAAAPASAQDEEGAFYPAAFVAPDHWSIDALRRLDGMGLLPHGFDAAAPLVPQTDVASLMSEAASAAPPGLRPTIEAWRDRFRAEYGLTADDARGALPFVNVLLRGTRVGVEAASRNGAVRRGWGYVDGYPPGTFWMEAEPLPDETEVDAAGALQVNPHPALSAVYRTGSTLGRLADDEFYGVLRGYGLALWAGDKVIRYGPGRSGGIVMSGTTPVRSVGIRTPRGFRLPWILRHIGPVSFEMFLGETDLPHSFEDVAILVTRGSVAPHERLRLGVSRGAMFGGDGNTDVDLFAIFSVFVGKHAGDVSELDNQVVAVDVQYRPPTEAWLPLRLYLEWGFEDSAGAYRDVPGILAGVEVPAVPAMPWLRLGVERTHFAPVCCGNPIWYRHATFLDGWTVDGRPLGHPLGGHGDQWSLLTGIDVADARIRLDAELFTRERGTDNIFEDARVGSSRGAVGRVELTLASRLEVWAAGNIDDGDDWRESRASVGLRALF